MRFRSLWWHTALSALAKTVAEENEYNEVLAVARTLASNIAEAAQEEFDGKSGRWQEGEKGIQVRNWVELCQMSLHDTDLELPEALAEIDPEEQADEL